MRTVCNSFQDDDSALREVEALIARGVPGEAVRVLRETPERDVHEDPHGSYAGGHGGDRVGSFAGPQATEAQGSYAPGDDAHAGRLGSFGDIDRDTHASFPCSVEDVSVTTHHRLITLLAEAGLDRDVAKQDVQRLHEGKVLVIARVPSEVSA
jgi:hypothetical protein